MIEWVMGKNFDIRTSLEGLFFTPQSLKNSNKIIFLISVNATVKFLRVGLSPSKKNCVIGLIESPLKLKKNAFYFILGALFVLKIFKFLSQLFGHVGKTA